MNNEDDRNDNGRDEDWKMNEAELASFKSSAPAVSDQLTPAQRGLLNAFGREFISPEGGVYGAGLGQDGDQLVLEVYGSEEGLAGLPATWSGVPVRGRLGSPGRLLSA